jgi:hypothetical protein
MRFFIKYGIPVIAIIAAVFFYRKAKALEKQIKEHTETVTTTIIKKK